MSPRAPRTTARRALVHRRGRSIAGALARSLLLIWGGFLLAAWIITSVVRSAAWWAELLRFVPYPLWLAPTLLLAPLAWRLGRRWMLLWAGMLVLVAAGLTEPAFGRAESGTVPLRVMTFNVKAYKAAVVDQGYGRMAWEVMQHDPDVLLLQDADFATVPNATLPVALKAIGQGRDVRMQGEYVVASRYPVKACVRGDLSFGQKQRQFVRCTLDVQGQALDVVTLHLQSPRSGLSAVKELRSGAGGSWRENFAQRLEQSGRLAGQLAGLGRPVIVGGDFNAVGSSPVLQPLRDIGLRDAFETASLGWGFTHGHTLRPGLDYWRLDHILVSPGIHVRAVDVGGAEASDHRPVIADLRLKAP